MGVIYKAQDLKLGSFVAFKFLPDSLAGGAQALERFKRGARTVYQDFFAVWKDAEADIRVLKQAKSEYENI